LLFNTKSKALQFLDEASESDAVFALHSFHNFKKWQDLVNNRKDKSIFVFPTELVDDKTVIEEFSHPAIAKIIVASEYYHRHFIKNLGFPTSFVRLIHPPTEDYRPGFEPKVMMNKRVVLTPASVRPEKNFEFLIQSMSELKKKYTNFHYIMLLSKHPSISNDEYLNLTQKFIDLLCELGLSEVSFITQPKLKYADYLSLANVILLPHDNSKKMYLSSLFDGVVANKPIVMPETNQTKDLIKRDIGALLYQPDNVQSVVDACGLLLDNRDMSDILIKQNSLIASNYLYSNISQQYINLFRRFKEV
jgi:glycosyltransferase involved in cell wall biosynthesis